MDSGRQHVASVKLLVVVWIGLMVGTVLTVAATYVDLGALNIWIGLLIATGKATLVMLYYMHLRWDRPFNALVFFTAVAFLLLFIGITMMDTVQYHDRLFTGGDTLAVPGQGS